MVCGAHGLCELLNFFYAHGAGFLKGETDVEVSREDMENEAPPVAVVNPQDPKAKAPRTSNDPIPTARTLASVWAEYDGGCTGGDRLRNNCAHYLSDAFIRAGFIELAPPNANIFSRCAPAKRPVRARDMWAWFQSKAIKSSRTIERNTGYWAIFQLDDKAYWGGHVIVLDTARMEYAGTDWYGEWDQYLYQW